MDDSIVVSDIGTDGQPYGLAHLYVTDNNYGRNVTQGNLWQFDFERVSHGCPYDKEHQACQNYSTDRFSAVSVIGAAQSSTSISQQWPVDGDA